MENYIAIAKSFVILLKPFLEVVIHDLASGKIIFIEGGLSKRCVGDLSHLEEDVEDWDKEVLQQVYPQLGYDGRLLKSITIPLREKGVVTALMCLNMDGTPFQNLKKLAELFLEGSQNDQPLPLFKNDWHERIHHFINDFLAQRHITLTHLTTKQKAEIVKMLFDQGAFNEKNAVDYIAKVLQMGRATIFNYLRKWKKKNDNQSL